MKGCVRCGLIAAFILVPGLARAQGETSSFADVPGTLKLGQKVVVTDVEGRKTKGNIAEVNSSSLTLLVRDRWGTEQRRSFDQGAVTTIRRTDSIWNGLLIGAGAGFVATAVWTRHLCGPRDEECSANVTAVGWVTMVPGGAAAGALIDRFIGNHLVYRAGDTQSTLRIAPLVGPKRSALSVSIAF
jgi:hypothetical protein